jgi:hypothetical protein
MRLGHLFYYRLVLMAEADSNSDWTSLWLGLDVLAALLRWWPRRRTSKAIS